MCWFGGGVSFFRSGGPCLSLTFGDGCLAASSLGRHGPTWGSFGRFHDLSISPAGFRAASDGEACESPGIEKAPDRRVGGVVEKFAALSAV